MNARSCSEIRAIRSVYLDGDIDSVTAAETRAQSLARLLDALASHPGLRLLELPAPNAREHLTESRDLRITVLR